MRFVPSYGGSLQVPGSPDHHRLIGEHICHPAHSGGSCPPVGVLVTLGPRSSHQEHICCIGNAFVTSGTHLSHQERVCCIRNAFVVLLILKVRALLWGFSSHREHVHHVVSFVILVIPEVCALQWGFSLSSVLFEFQEVWVVIVLSGMCSSCRSSSHSFHFVIWPSLSVSNA